MTKLKFCLVFEYRNVYDPKIIYQLCTGLMHTEFIDRELAAIFLKSNLHYVLMA